MYHVSCIMYVLCIMYLVLEMISTNLISTYVVNIDGRIKEFCASGDVLTDCDDPRVHIGTETNHYCAKCPDDKPTMVDNKCNG